MTFRPHPKVTSLTLGWKCYLHFVLLVIPVDLICHMTMSEKKYFWPPWAPQRPKVPPWSMTNVTEWKSRLLWFVSFICENTHKVWYKNLWNWHVNRNLMIFDLLTSPQGHQFDPSIKILLAFCSAHHPHWFDLPHYHVWKEKFFDPLGTLSAPKSDPWGMTQATELKSRLMCFLSFICENKHKVW